jgi:hypothetical protein
MGGVALRERVSLRALILISVMLAFGLRLYRLDHRPLRGDGGRSSDGR